MRVVALVAFSLDLSLHFSSFLEECHHLSFHSLYHPRVRSRRPFFLEEVESYLACICDSDREDRYHLPLITVPMEVPFCSPLSRCCSSIGGLLVWPVESRMRLLLV